MPSPPAAKTQRRGHLFLRLLLGTPLFLVGLILLVFAVHPEVQAGWKAGLPALALFAFVYAMFAVQGGKKLFAILLIASAAIALLCLLMVLIGTMVASRA